MYLIIFLCFNLFCSFFVCVSINFLRHLTILWPNARECIDFFSSVCCCSEKRRQSLLALLKHIERYLLLCINHNRNRLIIARCFLLICIWAALSLLHKQTKMITNVKKERRTEDMCEPSDSDAPCPCHL